MVESIQNQLFLVGCPRSGTTLLQSMVATHSQIASFPESHFLLATSRTWRGRLLHKAGLVSPEMRRRLRQFLTEIGHPELMPTTAYRLRPFIKTFAALLDQLALAQGKTRWLEKTPGHLYYIHDFEQALPDARFIHLIRNGADVVASLYEVTNRYPKQWGRGYTIEQCVANWNHSVALSLYHCAKPNHLCVTYEQLVADPAATLGTICQFIDVPWEAAMLDHYAQSADSLILTHEAWKKKTKQQITHEKLYKFHQIFTQAQQAEVLVKLNRTYETIPSPK